MKEQEFRKYAETLNGELENPIVRQQAQLLQNIDEINIINKKMGLPLIKVEVKTTAPKLESAPQKKKPN